MSSRLSSSSSTRSTRTRSMDAQAWARVARAPTAFLGRRLLDVERVEDRPVLLRHHLALHLERRRELPGRLREVVRDDRELLDRRVARLLRVQRVDRLLDA